MQIHVQQSPELFHPLDDTTYKVCLPFTVQMVVGAFLCVTLWRALSVTHSQLTSFSYRTAGLAIPTVVQTPCRIALHVAHAIFERFTTR